MVLENVIVPALVRECNNQDMQKRMNAVHALTKLGVSAKGAV